MHLIEGSALSLFGFVRGKTVSPPSTASGPSEPGRGRPLYFRRSPASPSFRSNTSQAMLTFDPRFLQFNAGWMTRFGPKMGQIGPKWDKSGTFFRWDFSTFWRRAPECTEIWSEKVPGLSHFGPICPILESNLPTQGGVFIFYHSDLFMNSRVKSQIGSFNVLVTQ